MFDARSCWQRRTCLKPVCVSCTPVSLSHTREGGCGCHCVCCAALRRCAQNADVSRCSTAPLIQLTTLSSLLSFLLLSALFSPALLFFHHPSLPIFIPPRLLKPYLFPLAFIAWLSSLFLCCFSSAMQSHHLQYSSIYLLSWLFFSPFLGCFKFLIMHLQVHVDLLTCP